MNLPDFIKNRRIELGLSQADLAKAAGVTQSALSKIEHGVKAPSLALAIDIANALDVSLDKLCGRVE